MAALGKFNLYSFLRSQLACWLYLAHGLAAKVVSIQPGSIVVSISTTAEPAMTSIGLLADSGAVKFTYVDASHGEQTNECCLFAW